MVENNSLGIYDHAVNVLDAIESIDSKACTSSVFECQIVEDELTMNENTDEVNVPKVNHVSVVVPSLVNLAKSVLARTVHELMQLHAKLIGSSANGSQLHTCKFKEC